MKVLIILAIAVAAASAGVISDASIIPATTFTRVPSLDSAVIKSDRLGGNFAYSVQEAHAYEAKTPIVQQVATPVAVSYSAGHPVQYAQYAPAYPTHITHATHAVPAVVKTPAVATTADHVTYTSAPVYTSGPVYASGPIIIAGPDGKFTELKLTH